MPETFNLGSYRPTVLQLGESSQNSEIVSFDELSLFTGIKNLSIECFNNCTSLESISIPESVTVIEGNSTLAKGVFYGCSALNNISLPSTLVTIGSCVFHRCSLIYLTELPQNVTTLDYGTFWYCQFETMVIKGVLNIPKRCFSNCDKLVRLDLSSNTLSIGDTAFVYCTALEIVICRATTPPSIVSNSFSRCPITNIYVPDGSVSAYQIASNWSAYAARIKPLSELV